MSHSTNERASVPIKLASTILLLRDGPRGMEVLMVVRHQQIDFASGALVFPGGKIADGDRDPRVVARCTGVAGLSADEIALRVGAIREAFEESGILLAQPGTGSAPLSEARLADLGTRYRRGLDRGEIGIADMLEAENLILDCAALTPFAHWITPPVMPKRFDTWFYLAATPPGQAALHDGTEAVDSAWLRPRDAIEQEKAGQRTIVPATLLNVQKLGRCDSVADAVAAARGSTIVSVLPQVERAEGGVWLRIPAEAGYDVTEFFMAMGAG